MRRPAVALAVALGAALSLARPARADGDAPTPAQIKEARQHFRAGKRLITKKQFADAVHELEAAYQLDPRTEHLYNLGVAHQLDGDDADAIAYYRLFLVDEPTGRTAANAEKYLAQLEAKATAEAAARRQAAVDEATRQAASGQDAADDARLSALVHATEVAELRAADLAREDEAVLAQEARYRAKIAHDDRRRDDARRLALRWKADALGAPGAGGRGRRVLGTLLLAAGAATIAYAGLDLVNRDSGGQIDTQVLVPAGTGAALLGLGLYAWGEVAVGSPRELGVLRRARLTPAIGAGTYGLVLSARF